MICCLLKSKKKFQSGRSMIEMLGVLAIVGVLSAGGIAGYSMAMQSHKTNALIEKIQLISSRTRTVYKNGNYTGFTGQNLVDAGKISSEDLKNPFGGNLGVAEYAPGTFYISMPSLPAESCTDILQIDWGYGVDVDGEHYRVPSTYPFTATQAISVCKGGNKGVAIIFL